MATFLKTVAGSAFILSLMAPVTVSKLHKFLGPNIGNANPKKEENRKSLKELKAPINK